MVLASVLPLEEGGVEVAHGVEEGPRCHDGGLVLLFAVHGQVLREGGEEIGHTIHFPKRRLSK